MTAQRSHEPPREYDFFSHSATPLAVLDANSVVLSANVSFAQSGAGKSVVGRRFGSLLCAGDRAHVEASLDVLEQGASVSFDARWDAPADGPPGPPHRFQVTRATERTLYVVGVAPPPGSGDEAPRLALFERLLDTAPLVLWAVDEEGTYTISEGKGLELLGFHAGEQVGLNALDMFKDHADTARALVRALSGEESRVMTTLAPGAHFENWYMPLRGSDGSVHGVMGLGIDASERVKTEQEIREKLELIERQSATIRSLATPIIQVWDEVLCLPVIGTVDSARTADMMQGLLEAIVREQARYAIVDLTGVEVVDTSTADHLIQLFRAARVLGVDGILCGIRPAVAQTVVALGLELGSVRTMRSLRDALKWCIRARKESRDGTSNGSNGAR